MDVLHKLQCVLHKNIIVIILLKKLQELVRMGTVLYCQTTNEPIYIPFLFGDFFADNDNPTTKKTGKECVNGLYRF